MEASFDGTSTSWLKEMASSDFAKCRKIIDALNYPYALLEKNIDTNHLNQLIAVIHKCMHRIRVQKCYKMVFESLKSDAYWSISYI